MAAPNASASADAASRPGRRSSPWRRRTRRETWPNGRRRRRSTPSTTLVCRVTPSRFCAIKRVYTSLSAMSAPNAISRCGKQAMIEPSSRKWKPTRALPARLSPDVVEGRQLTTPLTKPRKEPSLAETRFDRLIATSPRPCSERRRHIDRVGRRVAQRVQVILPVQIGDLDERRAIGLPIFPSAPTK